MAFSLILWLLHKIIPRRMLNRLPPHIIVIFLLRVSSWILFSRVVHHLIVLCVTLDILTILVSARPASWLQVPRFRMILVNSALSTSMAISPFALSLDEQWSIEHLCVNFYHFLFVLSLSFSFFLLELLDFWLNDRSWLSNVSHSAFSQHFPHIWRELLLSHFPHCRSPFLLFSFLHSLLFLFPPQIYQRQMLLRNWNVHLLRFIFPNRFLLWFFQIM